MSLVRACRRPRVQGPSSGHAVATCAIALLLGLAAAPVASAAPAASAAHAASAASKRAHRHAHSACHRRHRPRCGRCRRHGHPCRHATTRHDAAPAAGSSAGAARTSAAPALEAGTTIHASTPQRPFPHQESLRLFSAESVFNQPLPHSVPLAGNSSQLVGDFVSQVSKYYGHVVVNTTQWSTPVYVVGPTQPTVALVGESSICPRPEGVFSGFQAQIEAVPMPANAIPAAGTDKEVIVWQPSTGHLWELWRVLQEKGRWTACWGGEIADAYTSDGVLPAPFGAGASGLSLLGGQIHLEDLQHGSIEHALEVLMPDTANGQFVWPADRTDGTSTATDAIPEGTRFRLDPNLNLASLHLSPAGLEIATAVQRYGILVGDTAGSVALSAQDTTPIVQEGKPNPYDTLLPNPYSVLEAIPWSHLEAVSPGYHG
jgi:hypothetical protein